MISKSNSWRERVVSWGEVFTERYQITALAGLSDIEQKAKWCNFFPGKGRSG
jgi:hypothetical protein